MRILLLLITLALTLSSQGAELPKSLIVEPHQRDMYQWGKRHEAILERNKVVKPEYIALGDSITHMWSDQLKDEMPRIGTDSWNTLFKNHQVTNMGFGFDYIDNLYYRINNNALDNISPRVIILLIGTNNIGHRKDTADICDANMTALIKLIQQKSPKSKLLILGILPRKEKEMEAVIVETNKRYQALADNKTIFFAPIGNALVLEKTYRPKDEFMRDVVHVNDKGYAILALHLAKALQKIDPKFQTPYKD